MKSRSVTSWQGILASAGYGFFTGFLAGLVGLGGAELRIPFILYFLSLPLYEVIAANLIISLANSSVSFILRASLGIFTASALALSLAMILGSIPGGYLGAYMSHRISQRRLKAFMAAILSIVVFRLLVDIVVGPEVPGSVFPPYLDLVGSVLFGLGIGIIAGSIGVAGGEYRIPILVYAFGFPIKVAGTASQLVSIPTMVAGLVKHRDLGAITRRVLLVALVLGVPSVLGVVASTIVLVNASSQLIKLAFMLILLYTIVRLTAELAKRNGPKGTPAVG